jgi:hypothetical protein
MCIAMTAAPLSSPAPAVLETEGEEALALLNEFDEEADAELAQAIALSLDLGRAADEQRAGDDDEDCDSSGSWSLVEVPCTPGAALPPATGSGVAVEAVAAVAEADPACTAFLVEWRRCWTIWEMPGAPELVGVHAGCRWWTLAALLPGGRYAYREGHRLRGYDSIADAVAGYYGEAPSHNLYGPAQLHWHQ